MAFTEEQDIQFAVEFKKNLKVLSEVLVIFPDLSEAKGPARFAYGMGAAGAITKLWRDTYKQDWWKVLTFTIPAGGNIAVAFSNVVTAIGAGYFAIFIGLVAGAALEAAVRVAGVHGMEELRDLETSVQRTGRTLKWYIDQATGAFPRMEILWRQSRDLYGRHR